MKYNQLGKSALQSSEISMGCMSLQSSMSEATEVIDKALEYGVNLFDTADLYEFGLNEELLGGALGNKRQEVLIATKVGNQWTEAKDGWTWNPTKKHILQAVEASLKRLNTDYIDLYQLHGGTIDDPIDETIEAFEELKQQGKIREYGISSIRPNVIREYVKKSNIVSVMMQYSLLDRRPEEEIFDLLEKNNVSVIVRGALAKGLLVDKPASSYLSLNTTTVAGVQMAMEGLVTRNKLSNSQLAVRYALRPHPVATAAIGFRTVDQVNDLLQGFDSSSLPSEEFQELDQTNGVRIYKNHR